MKTLDRYWLQELLNPFLFGVAIFTLMYFAGDMLFDLLKKLTQQGFPFRTVARLFVYQLPSLMVVTFPMAMLLAALLTAGRMSSELEMAAMYAGGISLYRALIPAGVFAVAVAGFTLLFNETIVPRGLRAAEALLVGESRVLKNIVQVFPPEGPPQRIIYAQEINTGTGLMKEVDDYEYGPDGPVVCTHAKQAQYQGTAWVFRDGVTRSLRGDPIVAPFQRVQHNLGVSPEDIERQHKKIETMTIRELKDELLRLSRIGVGTRAREREAEVNLQARLAMPLSALIFCLVGLPLGIRPQRTSSSVGVGLSLLIIFVYYVTFYFTKIAAEQGHLQPMLAAWIANLGGLAAGAVLVVRSPK